MKVKNITSVEEIEHGYKVLVGESVFYLLKVKCNNMSGEKLLIVFIDGEYIDFSLTFEDYNSISIDFSIFLLDIVRIKSSCFKKNWLHENINTLLSNESKNIVENYLQQYKNMV